LSGREIPDRPRARDDVVFRRVGDGWAVYDPDASELHVLNPASALIWTHCDGTRTLDELVDSVAEAYERVPEREELRRDVEEAVRTFHGAGLLA
jgi:hypothetical protein